MQVELALQESAERPTQSREATLPGREMGIELAFSEIARDADVEGSIRRLLDARNTATGNQEEGIYPGFLWSVQLGYGPLQCRKTI
jgi:hypothetical protein